MQRTITNTFRGLQKLNFLGNIWQNHPFVIPVIVFLALFFISCATFVVMNGQTIGANDAKVVQLHIDGQTQVVPTRAHTVGELLEKNNIELREGDITEPSIDSPIVDQDFNVNIYRAKPVTVTDDKGHKVTVKVTETDPGEMAKKAGVTVYPEDNVDIAAPDESLRDGVIGPNIVIDRATPATVNLYGNTITARTHAQTVGELLEEKNIKTLEGDTVQPSPNTPLSENTQIYIVRYGKQIATVEEAIAAPVEKKSDPNALSGSTTVVTAGSPGKKVVTYEIELQNGKEVARRPIQEVVAVTPVTRIVSEGTKIVVSNPSANVEIGQRLAAERGWVGEEWYCLYQLWQKESRWSHLISNRSSGAYGIPQALPGSKMATIAPDWQTNPETQIKWGLGYIARSYKTPCGAWQKSRASGWY
jgi:uncharacterized protein YabE (DUF348 family)